MTKDCVPTELITPFGFSPVLQVREKLVPPNQPEFPVYVAIKFFIYGEIEPLFSLKVSEMRARLRAVVRGLSARRVHHMVTNGGGTQGQRRRRAYTDFYDTTSHFVKKRMDALNHGTILCVGGRGFRKAIAYRWNEPIDRYTVKSYRRLREILGSHVCHALDLYRLEDAFNSDAFPREMAIRLFQKYRQDFLEARWFGGVTGRSIAFTQFLTERMDDLAQEGFIKRLPHGRYKLTELGHEVTNLFELFINSVAYR